MAAACRSRFLVVFLQTYMTFFQYFSIYEAYETKGSQPMSTYVSRKERNVQSATAFPLCLCIYITNIHIKIFWRRKDLSPSLLYRNLNHIAAVKNVRHLNFSRLFDENWVVLYRTSCILGQIPTTKGEKTLCPSTYLGSKILCLYRIRILTSPELKDGGIRPIRWSYIWVLLQTFLISKFLFI